MNDPVLLTLLVPPRLADAVVELLLEHPATPPFTSVVGRGHGDDPDAMTLAEQVSGWRREVRMEVRIDHGDQEALLEALRTRMPTAAIRWRITPILAYGTLASQTSEGPAGDRAPGRTESS